MKEQEKVVNTKAFGFHNQGKKPSYKVGEETAFSGICDEEEIRGDKMGIYPYSAIGKIIVLVPGNKQKFGTGFLIGENVVLTCAHNIFYDQNLIDKSNIAFRVYDNDQKALKEYKIQEYYFPEEYKESKSQEKRSCYDYAVLIIQSDLSNTNGYLKPTFFWKVEKKISMKENFRVAGFQQEQTFIRSAQSKQGVENNPQITDDFIIHQLSTKGGDSGCPLLIQQEEVFSVFGIHIQGKDNLIQKDHNIAKTLNYSILKFLMQKLNNIKLKSENFSQKQFSVQLFQEMIQQRKDLNAQELAIIEADQNKFSAIPPFIYNKTQNLIYLNLRKNHIQQLTPEISKLTQLKVLLLSDNKLKTLPEEMKNLPLEELDLSRNELIQKKEEEESREFPWELIQELKLLQRLYLNGLKIQTIQSLPKSLCKLEVKENQLSELDIENFDQMINLIYLDASNNKIETINFGLCNLMDAEIILIGNNTEKLKNEQSYEERESYGQTITLQ